MGNLAVGDPIAGARNLICSCIGVRSDDEILLVREESRGGIYDDDAPACVEEEIRKLGASVYSLCVPAVAGPESVPQALQAAMGHVDHTIFFARIGDQLRFSKLPGNGTKTVVYALDVHLLGSEFSTIPHGFLLDVQKRLESEICEASEWRITCPLGTDVVGGIEHAAQDEAQPADFSVQSFPIATFRPLPCTDMEGRVVLSRWLNLSNTHDLEPRVIRLDEPITAVVKKGCIVDFEGARDVVQTVRRYYERVSSELGVDPNVVHSWHAGINPKTHFRGSAADHPFRWACMIFASPRHLHFHTCGAYAPGEITWSVLDASVSFDGRQYWRDGSFCYFERAEAKQLAREYSLDEEVFKTRQDIGV